MTNASLRPLRQRNFALVWSAALVSNIGSWMQTVAGGMCVVLGCLHFLDRGRHPQARSFYIGALRASPATRTMLALIEVAVGFLLLFTA